MGSGTGDYWGIIGGLLVGIGGDWGIGGDYWGIVGDWGGDCGVGGEATGEGGWGGGSCETPTVHTPSAVQGELASSKRA